MTYLSLSSYLSHSQYRVYLWIPWGTNGIPMQPLFACRLVTELQTWFFFCLFVFCTFSPFSLDLMNETLKDWSLDLLEMTGCPGSVITVLMLSPSKVQYCDNWRMAANLTRIQQSKANSGGKPKIKWTCVSMETLSSSVIATNKSLTCKPNKHLFFFIKLSYLVELHNT